MKHCSSGTEPVVQHRFGLSGVKSRPRRRVVALRPWVCAYGASRMESRRAKHFQDLGQSATGFVLCPHLFLASVVSAIKKSLYVMRSFIAAAPNSSNVQPHAYYRLQNPIAETGQSWSSAYNPRHRQPPAVPPLLRLALVRCHCRFCFAGLGNIRTVVWHLETGNLKPESRPQQIPFLSLELELELPLLFA
jgi:hypothetical protein